MYVCHPVYVSHTYCLAALFQDCTVTGALTPSSQCYVFRMLLLIVRNNKVWCWGILQCNDIYTKCLENQWAILGIEIMLPVDGLDMWTQAASVTISKVHFIPFKEGKWAKECKCNWEINVPAVWQCLLCGIMFHSLFWVIKMVSSKDGMTVNSVADCGIPVAGIAEWYTYFRETSKCWRLRRSCIVRDYESDTIISEGSVQRRYYKWR